MTYLWIVEFRDPAKKRSRWESAMTFASKGAAERYQRRSEKSPVTGKFEYRVRRMVCHAS